jgi:hypothetical protein
LYGPDDAGVPLTVAAFPDGVKVSPAGSDPGLIDQLNGPTPPATPQVAVYGVPTTVGPVAGVHRKLIGPMIVPL